MASSLFQPCIFVPTQSQITASQRRFYYHVHHSWQSHRVSPFVLKLFLKTLKLLQERYGMAHKRTADITKYGVSSIELYNDGRKHSGACIYGIK
mmetsp:Transcript_18996/g.32669  ORF Transcript_18996/g.32669 Transcript_18996/m.32669 type:complete len:94 (+) Transcript_18996:807-1088(+)